MGVTAQGANAQGMSFHADITGGISSSSAAGDSDSHLGWGASAGADFDMGGFVVAQRRNFGMRLLKSTRSTVLASSTTRPSKSMALVCAPVSESRPARKVYGKVAWVRNEQRKRFTPLAGVGYYDHYNVTGWQWGLGLQQVDMNNVYVKAEGRYSDYKAKLHSGGTHTLTGLLGLGIMFGGAAPAPVIVPTAPPPAPVAPATQTCPDGSVILATDVCPPPPPPPPPPVERGERG